MTKSLDTIDGKLSKAGVNLTDAEKERVDKLSSEGDLSTAAAVAQVLDERVGPAADSFQDYPDVYDLLGEEEPKRLRAELPEGFVHDPRTGVAVQDTVEPKPEKVSLSGKGKASAKDVAAAAQVKAKPVPATTSTSPGAAGRPAVPFGAAPEDVAALQQAAVEGDLDVSAVVEGEA